ncbi:tRNA (cytidine(34)-2'-O)-methyltransferase [Boudabousia marimammalium]|uniref:Putative tRNA (cytidine(34)-2'-O)-methyltransferase n=1 Tax=Boudabousia marimammalium TaxID=156892 RepID=A0A1Q5PR59_9ACTO|nr:tRNA (cytidine(34)-2'-O)-methyltransferase [Boudabousia marimammalium]OKL50054.1 tRNA (uridine(34)/cytosine(34)/5-carboxymethylaminomethyluridine(34)-2'-O)-methyltransferase TrmL [Boudabousia marimammalium]
MLHIIFYEPRIAGNTGAAIRLSANTGSMLHLVEPLCFEMEDTKLRRAGLDYHDLAHVKVHPNFEDALADIPGKIYAFTGRGQTYHTAVSYQDGDGLLFGPEPTGLPDSAMEHPRIEDLVRIPMRPGNRSLNLANSAAIAIYEAWRQLDFVGGE